MRRKRLSKRRSKKNFRSGAKTAGRNFWGHMRGGFRI